ncbi:MAG: RNA 2'-phosphotransferase [Thermodesulfobacteriota bacterium]
MAAGQRLKQQKQGLARFLAYILGIRPDEFGLFTDEQGYLPLKDLLMALSEEEDWRYVRENHVLELLREPGQNGLEIKEKLIRLRPEVSSLALGPFPTSDPPKLLHHAARRQAYAVILEQGLKPGARPLIPLAVTPKLAFRIGRRRDQDPVPLIILAQKAAEAGVVFYCPQELLYLVDALPPEFLSGPPLPKEKLPAEKKKQEAPPSPPTPGSFPLDPSRFQEPGLRPDQAFKKKKTGEPDWKRNVRRERRRRER